MADNGNAAVLVIGVLLVVLITAGLTYYITKTSTVPVTPVQNETNETGVVPTITVRGEATRTLSPDQMVISLTIASLGADAAASQAQSATDTAAVKAALLAAGLNASEIQTSSYYTNPVYNDSCYSDCYPNYYSGGGYGYAADGAVRESGVGGASLQAVAGYEKSPDVAVSTGGVAYTDIAPSPPYPCRYENNCSITGYKTSHVLTVKSSKTTDGGKFIAAAVNATNDTSVDYVYFTITEETRVSVESELQASAASAAKAKAENIAQGLGARLGKIVSINPDYYYPYYPVYAYDRSSYSGGMESAPAAPPTEIFPTDTTMSNSITVVYELVQ